MLKKRGEGGRVWWVKTLPLGHQTLSSEVIKGV